MMAVGSKWLTEKKGPWSLAFFPGVVEKEKPSE
jgi:hypothetical protein